MKNQGESEYNDIQFSDKRTKIMGKCNMAGEQGNGGEYENKEQERKMKERLRFHGGECIYKSSGMS